MSSNTNHDELNLSPEEQEKFDRLERLIFLSLCARHHAEEIINGVLSRAEVACERVNQQPSRSRVARVKNEQMVHVKSERSIANKVLRKRAIPSDIARLMIEVSEDNPQDMQDAVADFIFAMNELGFDVWRPSQYPENDLAYDNRFINPLPSGYCNIAISFVSQDQRADPVIIEVQFLQPSMREMASEHVAYDMSKQYDLEIKEGLEYLMGLLQNGTNLSNSSQQLLVELFDIYSKAENTRTGLLEMRQTIFQDTASIEERSQHLRSLGFKERDRNFFIGLGLALDAVIGTDDKKTQIDLYRFVSHAKAFLKDNPVPEGVEPLEHFTRFLKGFEENPKLQRAMLACRAGEGSQVSREDRASHYASTLQTENPEMYAQISATAHDLALQTWKGQHTALAQKNQTHCTTTRARITEFVMDQNPKNQLAIVAWEQRYF